MSLEGRAFALRHLYVYPRLGIAYTYIPKNACTSFKSTLGRGQGWLAPDHASAHEMRASRWAGGLVRYWSAHERIVVVRDPWDRVLSGFLNRFLMREDRASELAISSGIRSPVGAQRKRPDVTFADFVRYLTEASDRELNEHWRPQSNFLIGSYTRVLRFDRLPEEAAFLAERGLPLERRQGHSTSAMRRDLGPGWADAPVRRLRRLRRTKSVLPSRESMYDDRLRQLVAERYADDVALFRAQQVP